MYLAIDHDKLMVFTATHRVMFGMKGALRILRRIIIGDVVIESTADGHELYLCASTWQIRRYWGEDNAVLERGTLSSTEGQRLQETACDCLAKLAGELRTLLQAAECTLDQARLSQSPVDPFTEEERDPASAPTGGDGA